MVSGRERFGDKASYWYYVSVLAEELGKLARAGNKLRIAKNRDVRQQWYSEGRYRLVTITAMARRMAEVWDEVTKEGVDSHV